MASNSAPSYSNWSMEENKAFEDAVAVHFNDDDKWRKIAHAIPGKTIEDLKLHYEALHDDVVAIESAKVPLPRYTRKKRGSTKNKNQRKKKKSPRVLKKGPLWTESEHRRFLYGLERFGRGDWKSIARFCVRSKTNSQVASHAQKFYNRLKSDKEVKRSSINDITLDYPLENPSNVMIRFDTKKASTDAHVEKNPPPFVGEKITDPGPSTTKLLTHDACVASAKRPSTLGLDFEDKMIVDPSLSSVNQSIQALSFASQNIMDYSSSETMLLKNGICVPEYSNNQINDLGFASQSIVASVPSMAQVPNLDTVIPESMMNMPIHVSGFTSHTIMDPSPSMAQLPIFDVSDLPFADQLIDELYFGTQTVADPFPSTVQLPAFDIYTPVPSNEPIHDSDLSSLMIKDSGHSRTESPTYNSGVASSLNQQIQDHAFNFASQIVMDPNPSPIEFPTFEFCDPVLTNQPIQDMDLDSLMIIDSGPSTAQSSTFDAHFPALIVEPIQDTDLLYQTIVGHHPSAAELTSNICVPEIFNQPIQDLDFVTGMIMDPDFSTSQFPICGDFALSFPTEPIQDTDLTSLMDMDPAPMIAQLQNHDDFAPTSTDQLLQGFDTAWASEMEIGDEFMLPRILDMD